MREWPENPTAKGITLTELTRLFPDEEAATEWFASIVWAGERCLRALRKPQHQARPQCEADAVLVPRLPEVFQRAHRNDPAPLAHIAPELGLRDLSRSDEPQGRVQHQARPRPGDQPEVGVVHAPPHPRDVGSEARKLRWSCRVRRDLHRRQGEEPAREQAPESRARPRGQDGGRRGQGSGDEPREGPRHQAHGLTDASSFRTGQRGRRREALHGRRCRVQGPREPRDGQALGQRVRQRPGPHERHRELLERCSSADTTGSITK